MPTMKAVSMVTSSALPWSCLFVLIFIVYLWGLNGEFYGFRMTTLADRSEEHTSELQSRSDLVCRLLLEKKKIIVCPDLEPAHAVVDGIERCEQQHRRRHAVAEQLGAQLESTGPRETEVGQDHVGIGEGG